MNPLLEQFLSESREFSQAIGAKLMQLEDAPTDQGAINELFRLVHTLKGNSGLFAFPEMTRVLHAGEDLLGMVRSGRITYSRELADRLLEAIDFVMALCAQIERTESIDACNAQDSWSMAESLRALMPAEEPASANSTPFAEPPPVPEEMVPLGEIPEAVRIEALRRSHTGEPLHWIVYAPAKECFFQGDDPFYAARQAPGLIWGRSRPRDAMPLLAELDTYSCLLEFDVLAAASREELDAHFRYVPDQVRFASVDPSRLAAPHGAPERIPVPSLAIPDAAESEAFEAILSVQRQILALSDRPEWLAGRLQAVAAVLANLSQEMDGAAGQIEAAFARSLEAGEGAPLLSWLDANRDRLATCRRARTGDPLPASSPCAAAEAPRTGPAPAPEDKINFGRRAEDNGTAVRCLKVDQAKIDRLMNLIGELVVSKNSLPYLAQRAETQYGVRELAREIKGEYAVVHRIAEEMQDSIMQVRMMAVSFVFQRFPRLVRDISRKLGKEVQLTLEGEQSEADKNIVEALADPLIHIVRNSLDHGIETPEVRRASGKPEMGTITIRAAHEGDRVTIEVSDDGKGIDPAAIKRKAYEKGLIDEAALEHIGDREAVNLIFAAGLSTAETVSDLSGRGVGMDVVRTAVQKLNGTVTVDSVLGKGASIRISLPLSMAVTQVMIVESDGQLFGVPMDSVIETVRVPSSGIHAIKQSLTAVLRGRIVPLKALNALLGIAAKPRANADDELAVLLVRAGGEVLGLLVDGFRETMDVIQKPLMGFLSGLPAYSGSALLGDGSVLMILNLKEIV